VLALLLGGVTAGSFVITGYLARLEVGIDQNAAALGQTVQAQRAILRQNELLDEMLLVTGRLSHGLNQVLAVTEAIDAQVLVVRDANAATLQLNRAVEGHNAAAAQDLARVAAALAGMNQSASAIDQYLTSLSQTATADVDYLNAIAINTARMNARTPGW
jgi:hypothetical protein